MAKRSLFLFLEGNDDERFFARILVPLLERKYRKVMIWKYARMKRRRTIQFLRSVQKAGADYIFVRDIDNAPSVSEKIGEIVLCHEGVVRREAVCVVVMEIESWYLAGHDRGGSHIPAVVRCLERTDTVTKEEFNRMVPRPMSRIEFMHLLLENFSVKDAMERNASFRFFLNRWVEDGEYSGNGVSRQETHLHYAYPGNSPETRYQEESSDSKDAAP